MTKRQAILDIVAGACLAAAVFTTAADAAEMRLQASENRVINLAAKAGTIVVSNPEFVSVRLLSSRRLLLQGLSTGYSNVLVMDKKGNRLADLDVSVSSRYSSRELRTYVAGERATYTCNPDCARVATPQDGARSLTEMLYKHRRFSRMRDLYMPESDKRQRVTFSFGF